MIPIRIFMKVTFLLVMCCVMLPLPVRAQGPDSQSALTAPQFFTSLQDVPLMPGLRELTDLTVIFDKPEGRIIESVAAMDSLTVDIIRRYYKSSLPQLGWNRIGQDYFARQGEYLRLNFETVEGQGFLKIIIMPHG